MSTASSAAMRDLQSSVDSDTLRSPPPDWPAPGDIDLSVHDMPHSSSALEWWYVNSHFETSTGRHFSVFAAFFRQTTGFDSTTQECTYTHSAAWALSDPTGRRYHSKTAVDGSAAQFALKKLDLGAGSNDHRVNRALREVFERGEIPGPTGVFSSAVCTRDGHLDLDYGGDRFHKLADGTYCLELCDRLGLNGCNLLFAPSKPPTRHGNDGVVNGVDNELMFYYFVPRCILSGSVLVDGHCDVVKFGHGWYDHEFGVVPKDLDSTGPISRGRQHGTAWRWVSVQLEGGIDVSVYIITRPNTGEVVDNWTIISAPNGRAMRFTDANLEPISTWRSTRSFVEYPTAWTLEVPSAGLRLHIYAAFADQEVLTIISDPGFWEGRVTAFGSYRGQSAVGLGWVECKGFRFESLDTFFHAVGLEVRERISELLPLSPTADQICHWAVRGTNTTRCESRDYLKGLQPSQVVRALAKPVREIADRGGKSWRSYAALASVDVVGGDSRKFLHWLALPELLHVGSLIVDDVEDRSLVRRGGPTCHLLYGEAIALNAGTAAYFLAEPPVLDDQLPQQAKLQIYRLYFDAVRAAHVGQALDLDGLNDLAKAAATTGNADELEQTILCIHRLKTAVPASRLAMIGAILGGGTEVQVDALGRFFEAVGLAFQIIDDVLNARGFLGNLKERGEDIRQGKVTLPIAKACRVLSPGDRWSLIELLLSTTKTEDEIELVIEILESTGALQACISEAHTLVETAWANLDPHLAPSQAKVMFRAFCWYVLERHY